MNDLGRAARAWQAMSSLVHDRNDRRKDVCDALGMSFAKVKALRRLAADPMTMRELAEHMFSDPPYITLIVDELERRRLVQRSVDPADRRRKIVSVTEDGRSAAQRAERILGEPPAALVALPEDDLVALERILPKLLA